MLINCLWGIWIILILAWLFILISPWTQRPYAKWRIVRQILVILELFVVLITNLINLTK